MDEDTFDLYLENTCDFFVHEEETYVSRWLCVLARRMPPVSRVWDDACVHITASFKDARMYEPTCIYTRNTGMEMRCLPPGVAEVSNPETVRHIYSPRAPRNFSDMREFIRVERSEYLCHYLPPLRLEPQPQSLPQPQPHPGLQPHPQLEP